MEEQSTWSPEEDRRIHSTQKLHHEMDKWNNKLHAYEPQQIKAFSKCGGDFSNELR